MKQVIVMRTDLNMRKGKMVAQGSHASMAAVLGNLNNPYVRHWLGNLFTKIIVGIDSEEKLLQLFEYAKDKHLLVSLITDSGLTEFNGVPTNTCIAIGPAPDTMFVGLTDHLKLL